MSATEHFSSDELAVQRTAMAAERTLMGWVRTALSLIGFGFTIYKFLQTAVVSAETAGVAGLRMQGPRRLGLFLLALGTASVVLGSIEYFGTIRRLNSHSQVRHNPMNFAFVLGIIIGLLGAFLFLTILVHAEVF